MSYKVIARKYRPQTFTEIVGQQHVTQTLANAIKSNRVAHAYIFSGVRGVGKTTTPRALLAQTLNWRERPPAEPDNALRLCREEISASAQNRRSQNRHRAIAAVARFANSAGGALRAGVEPLRRSWFSTAHPAHRASIERPAEDPRRMCPNVRRLHPRHHSLRKIIRHDHDRAHALQLSLAHVQGSAGEIERVYASENLRTIDPGAVAVLARACAEGNLRATASPRSSSKLSLTLATRKITDTQVRELLGVVAESVLDELVEAIALNPPSAPSASSILTHHRRAKPPALLPRSGRLFPEFALSARVCGADSDLVTAPPDERPRLVEQTASFYRRRSPLDFPILYLPRTVAPQARSAIASRAELLARACPSALAPLEEILADLRGESPRSGASAPPRDPFRRAPSRPLNPPTGIRHCDRNRRAQTALNAARAELTAPSVIGTPCPRASREFAIFTSHRSNTAARLSTAASSRTRNSTSGLTSAQVDAIKAALKSNFSGSRGGARHALRN